ncbi:MAG: hypothetical protein AB1768_00970 [Pseudomonadota bacterium]
MKKRCLPAAALPLLGAHVGFATELERRQAQSVRLPARWLPVREWYRTGRPPAARRRRVGAAGLRRNAALLANGALAGKSAWGHRMLNAYETRVDDLIAFDATLSARNNIDQARIRGLEAVIGTKLGARGINTSPTLLDPENRSSGVNDGNVLPRRASGANTTHKVTAAR